MSDWQVKTLDDLVRLQRGFDLPTSTRNAGTVQVIGAAGASGLHDIARTRGPGVVLGRAGASMGHATYCRDDFWPLNTALFVTDFLGNDPRFAYYLLSQIDFSGYNSGSAQPALNRNYIKHVSVCLPERAEQERISSLLGALDDKIMCNAHVAATADALSAAIIQRVSAETPHEMVARPLSQIAAFINGRAFTKDATGTGRMVIRIAEINSGPGPSTVYNDLTVDERHLARPGDVLFAWSGSLTVARWYRPEAIINQHIFKVIPTSDVPAWLVFDALKSKLAHFQAIAAGKATTMGHIQRHHLDETVLLPSAELVARLHPSAASLWNRALVAEQESLTLTALRDMLLPELMSGRLRIRDAEKAVEEVV